MKQLSVVSTGKAAAPVDIITISLTIAFEDKDYGEALSRLGQKASDLAASIYPLLGAHCLKTENFGVDTVYENIRDQNGSYKRTFSGYRARESYSLEINFSTSLLGALLEDIAESNATPEIDLTFSVKDAEALRESALKNAMKLGIKRAGLMADALGVDLLSISEISYSTPLNYGETISINETMPLKSGARAVSTIAISPKDAEVKETVTIVWEIE
ncbi:MAG: SIMPL domain-containing protein [Clostridia bacterium]